MVLADALQDDIADGSMHCADHPFKTGSPGGICAFCLREKLSKLVSSSFPIASFPPHCSSSSPSFRSDSASFVTASSIEAPFPPNASSSSANATHKAKNDLHYDSSRPRMSSLLNQGPRINKKSGSVTAAASDQTDMVFKRSKSTVAPRRTSNFLEDDEFGDYSPRKRGFWSFSYLTKQSSCRKMGRPPKDICFSSSATASSVVGSSSMNASFSQQRPTRHRKKKEEPVVVVDENGSPDRVSFEKRVSRSRSIGCGSRSFSGDIFERISNGFGDCTLRRVESQREGRLRIATVLRGAAGGGAGQDSIKERVKCGGIFSGFTMNSSSSTSSASSTEDNVNGKTTPSAAAAHGKSKSWGWALASPIRVFSKPPSGKREPSNKTVTPNLDAVPSLLAARG